MLLLLLLYCGQVMELCIIVLHDSCTYFTSHLGHIPPAIQPIHSSSQVRCAAEVWTLSAGTGTAQRRNPMHSSGESCVMASTPAFGLKLEALLIGMPCISLHLPPAFIPHQVKEITGTAGFCVNKSILFGLILCKVCE